MLAGTLLRPPGIPHDANADPDAWIDRAALVQRPCRLRHIHRAKLPAIGM